MKLASTLFLIVFLFISCNSPSASSSKKIINLDKVADVDGFIDLPFTIVKQTSNNGFLTNTVQAVSKGDTVELLISLKEGVPSGFVDGVPKNMFLDEGIIFESTGFKSDKLLNVLASKYGMSENNMLIKDKQVFNCANLNQVPLDYKNGTCRFKIFLQDETQDAELFVNFDFKNSTISLNEKDIDYRTPLINLMKK